MQSLFSTGIFKTLGRLLSLLSVLTLVMAGGIFAHADEMPHQHIDLASGQDSPSVSHHDHLSSGTKGDTKLSGIHCGADIHLLCDNLTLIFLKLPTAKILRQSCDCRMVLFRPDPPPPRLVS